MKYIIAIFLKQVKRFTSKNCWGREVAYISVSADVSIMQ